MGCKRAQEAAGPRPPAGVTALIVAMKPGNAGGAKGCRKVETRLSHQRKKPTVMPAGASYGTAREGNHPSERPIGSTPKLDAEPRVWTARLLAALDKRGQRRQGNRPEHQCRLDAAVAEPGLFACKAPMTRLPVLSQVRPPTGEPDAGDPHVRFGGRGSRTQSALPTPITAPPLRSSQAVAIPYQSGKSPYRSAIGPGLRRGDDKTGDRRISSQPLSRE